MMELAGAVPRVHLSMDRYRLSLGHERHAEHPEATGEQGLSI